MSLRPVNNTKSDSDLPGDELLQLSQLALDVTSDACMWADQAGHILYANETACRALGYTKDELLSMKVTDIEVYYDEQRYSQFWEEIKRSGSVRLESVHARKDGSRFPVQMTINYVKRGEKEYAFNFIRDITERKRAEEALRGSEESYRGLVESTGDWVWETDKDFTLTYDSPKSREFLGYELDDVIGRSPFSFMPKDEFERIKLIAGPVIARHEPIPRIENQLKKKDGSIVIIETTGVPLFDDSGHFRGYRGVNRDITERKLAEEALMIEKYILTKSQEIAHVGNWVYDQQADEFMGSAENDRIYGYVPGKDKATRDWVLSRIHPEDQDRFADFMEARAKDGKRGSIDYRIVASDGSVKDVNSIVDKTVFDKAGRVLQVYGTSQDITERKRAEEALRDNEQFLNNVFDCIKDGISVLDRDLNIIRTNRTMELWHPDALPLVGKKCHSAYHGRMEACPGCPSVKAIKEKSPVACVVSRDVAGKTVGWQEVYSFPLLDDRRDVVGVIDYVRDITDRKIAEDALRESEEKFRALADSARVGIFLTRGGKFLYVNQEMTTVLGFSKDELLAMHFLDVVHPDSRELVTSQAEARLRGIPVSPTYEIKVVTKGGEVLWTQPSSIVIDYMGEPALLVTISNITDRKRVEEELKAAKAQSELYLDLMGHDINNMHQIALGYLELARGMPPGVQHDEMIEKPIEVLQRSARLIKNVRKLQKLHDGAFKTDQVDVCQVLAGVRREFGAMSGKTVTLNTNGHTHCPVQANDLLHDLFSNLVGNAIKHTGDRAEILVDLDVVDDGRCRLCRVMVEDNGPGIPDDFKGRIFNRMLRGTTKAKGMGLGLYLVKSLVESYGGRVWVEDRVKGDHTKGARFVVMLPAVEQ